jgi:putative membrane protein
MNMKTNYRNTFFAMACLALSIAPAAVIPTRASDNGENPGQFSAADYRFVKAAACGGMMEVTLGKVAAERSANPAVQQFGQRMVADHGKAGAELNQIAARRGASLPAALTASQQKEVDRLAKLSSPEFDKVYVPMMVRDHKADEKEFRRASEKVKDPDLKTFAATTLAVIQDHLRMAEELDASIRHHEVSMDK